MSTVMRFKIEFSLERQPEVQVKVRNPGNHSCKTSLLSLAFLLNSAGKAYQGRAKAQIVREKAKTEFKEWDSRRERGRKRGREGKGESGLGETP